MSEQAPVAERVAPAELVRRRQARLGLAGAHPRPSRPADATSAIEGAARRLFALQGQDLPGTLWALGLRTGATREQVRAAFDAGRLVRSWPFRGTLHAMAAADLPWVLAVTGGAMAATLGPRRRQLAIDEDVIARARRAAVARLRGGERASRGDLLRAFQGAGVQTRGQRGYHLLFSLALEGTLVLGPFADAEQQFVLVGDWLKDPPGAGRDRAGAVREIVWRYLVGHGPATEADAARFARLGLREVRAALAHLGGRVRPLGCAGRTYWEPADAPGPARLPRVLALPGFDEFMLGYADRDLVVDPAHARAIVPGGNGMFKATVVARGRVVATWTAALATRRLGLAATPLGAPLPPATLAGLRARALDYARFLGMDDARIEVSDG